MGLQNSARLWVLENLPYNRNDAELCQHLNGLDLHGLFIVFHNWMSRQIKPVPRILHMSKCYMDNPLRQKFQTELSQIELDIRKGNNLKKYLSRRVDFAVNLPNKKLGNRQDLDFMLITQKIYHLHISTKIEADGYVKRSKHLIFVTFKPRAAYLIEIMSHGDWARDHVLKVLLEEWPNAQLVLQIRNIAGLQHNYTENERLKLQSAGINTIVALNSGAFVMPAGLVSTAGTSAEATTAADNLIEKIEAFERLYQANPKRMRAVFTKNKLNFPEGTPHYTFSIQPSGPGVIETNTRTFVPFDLLDLMIELGQPFA